jgi:hypothetical protein
MYLVNSAQPEQQISLWLLSTTAEIKPIKVVLAGKSDRYANRPGSRLRPDHEGNREAIQAKARTCPVQEGFEKIDCKDVLG